MTHLPMRENFLIAHGACPKSWAKKYDIEPFDLDCSKCGETMTTSLPFTVGQFRGLVAPQCYCGNEDTPYCIVRDFRFGDLFSGSEDVR